MIKHIFYGLEICTFSHLYCALGFPPQTGNQHVDLNFRGVNYSAEVYLNGHKKDLEKGMFLRHSLDVTDIVNLQGKNMLAVLVYPPDNPGKIPLEGGQGGDHEVTIHLIASLFSSL